MNARILGNKSADKARVIHSGLIFFLTAYPNKGLPVGANKISELYTTDVTAILDNGAGGLVVTSILLITLPSAPENRYH